MTTAHLHEQLLHLPKVELHVHLEGCVSLASLKILAQQNKVQLPAHLTRQENIQFANFDEFVQTFYAICHSIQREDDFVFLANDLADYIEQNHIIYCETSFTPVIYLNKGFRFEKIMQVINETLNSRGLGGQVHFIIDTQRDHGVDTAAKVFQTILETPDSNIVAVGMTGQEVGYQAADYKYLYQKMRDAGLQLAAHAGEYGGAHDIWQCLLDLGVQRIGHGIRAIDDEKLMGHIKANNIHLEICPTSNVRLCRVPDLASHPVKEFIHRGLNVGINADDPGIFNTTVTDEYVHLMTIFGYDTAVLKQCNLNAAQASFAPPVVKEYVINTINQYWPTL